jgi:hypothetical protein
MNNNITPQQAIQLLSEALEPKAQGQISRAGYIAIQKALETIATIIPKEETPTEPQPTE